MNLSPPKKCECAKCGSKNAVSNIPIVCRDDNYNLYPMSNVHTNKKSQKFFEGYKIETINYLATVCTDCGYSELVAHGNLKSLLQFDDICYQGLPPQFII